MTDPTPPDWAMQKDGDAHQIARTWCHSPDDFYECAAAIQAAIDAARQEGFREGVESARATALGMAMSRAKDSATKAHFDAVMHSDIAEQIAAVQREVRRMEDCQGDWRLYLEKLSPESVGYKSATISLKHLARLRGALATLQSHERLQAEHERAMKVVRGLAEYHKFASAADGDDYLNGDSDTVPGRCGHDEIEALGQEATEIVAAYDAALSPPVEETE